MREQIKTSVLSFLENKNAIPGSNEVEKLNCNYLEAGLLDSLGLVELVSQLEDQFKITFSDSDMQSPDFQTIGGLIEITNSLCAQAA